jgi:hypothetical protein
MNLRHLLLIYFRNDIDIDEGIKERLALTGTRLSQGRVLWISVAPPADISATLAELLSRQVVTSAALVRADIAEERLWVAHEWFGAFVVDRDLVGLAGERSGIWIEDYSHDAGEFRVLILRPAHPASPDDSQEGALQQVETTREYATAITHGQSVVVDTTLAAVRRAMGDWFGDLADPRVGGAFALLALSDARSDSNGITLRSPAALGLKVALSDVSLSGHARAGRLAIRGYGYSDHNAQRVAAATPGLPELAERVLLEALGGRTHYGILLEIEVNVDPEVEIGEGSLFEQVSLNDVQTLAAAEPRQMTVGVGRFAPLALPAWCLNKSLAPPAGQQVRPTPLVLNTPGQSQHEVWAERRSVLARRPR